MNCIPVAAKETVYDFGVELFGYLFIQSVLKPTVSIRESEMEAMDTLNHPMEQTNKLIAPGKTTCRTKVPVAFSYVKVLGGLKTTVSCLEHIQLLKYNGAFLQVQTPCLQKFG